MSTYEGLRVQVTDEANVPEAAREAAADAMAFVESLHKLFRENGYVLPEDPDCTALENVVDAFVGELTAACLYLAHPQFREVPNHLRHIAATFDEKDVPFTDAEGITGPSVPLVVRMGFSNLAGRIEATREQLNMTRVESTDLDP